MQKYKVFLNEKRIGFVPGANITLSKLCRILTENSGIEAIMDWLPDFENSDIRESVVEHPEVEKLFQNFRSAFLQIDAAGGVVKRDGKLLFIFRNGKWDLPKGKIDEGESIETAALREVEEELWHYKSFHSKSAAINLSYLQVAVQKNTGAVDF